MNPNRFILHPSEAACSTIFHRRGDANLEEPTRFG
jgi:hypothetical protein